MKLKEIVFAGALFLSSSVAFSQDNLNFDVYNDWLLGINLNMSSLRITPKKIDFSFLKNLYSMEFNQLNDSTYQEIVRDNWARREEFFDYSKDSCYTLINYSVVKGEAREEKVAVIGRVFDKKYKSLFELFDDLENGRIKDGDSIHFPILGMPYSLEVNKQEEQHKIVYLGELEVKRDSGDTYIIGEPVKLYTTKENGKETPNGFFSAILNVKRNKKVSIEGRLKGKRD